MVFSLEVLSTLMADSAVRGLSIIRELQPLGGRGDAVSPPTFAQAEGDERGPRYVWSERRIGDETVRTCLLDSPASQANRIEESLLDLVQADKLTLPLHRMDVPNIGVLTDLELPHRVYDAAIGTSTLADGTKWSRFGRSAKQVRQASRKNATALLEHAPLILVLGGWDSHSGTDGGERLAGPSREGGLVQNRSRRCVQDESSRRSSRSYGPSVLRHKVDLGEWQ